MCSRHGRDGRGAVHARFAPRVADIWVFQHRVRIIFSETSFPPTQMIKNTAAQLVGICGSKYVYYCNTHSTFEGTGGAKMVSQHGATTPRNRGSGRVEPCRSWRAGRRSPWRCRAACQRCFARWRRCRSAGTNHRGVQEPGRKEGGEIEQACGSERLTSECLYQTGKVHWGAVLRMPLLYCCTKTASLPSLHCEFKLPLELESTALEKPQCV